MQKPQILLISSKGNLQQQEAMMMRSPDKVLRGPSDYLNIEFYLHSGWGIPKELVVLHACVQELCFFCLFFKLLFRSRVKCSVCWANRVVEGYTRLSVFIQ